MPTAPRSQRPALWRQRPVGRDEAIAGQARPEAHDEAQKHVVFSSILTYFHAILGYFPLKIGVDHAFEVRESLHGQVKRLAFGRPARYVDPNA